MLERYKVRMHHRIIPLVLQVNSTDKNNFQADKLCFRKSSAHSHIMWNFHCMNISTCYRYSLLRIEIQTFAYSYMERLGMTNHLFSLSTKPKAWGNYIVSCWKLEHPKHRLLCPSSVCTKQEWFICEWSIWLIFTDETTRWLCALAHHPTGWTNGFSAFCPLLGEMPHSLSLCFRAERSE